MSLMNSAVERNILKKDVDIKMVECYTNKVTSEQRLNFEN